MKGFISRAALVLVLTGGLAADRTATAAEMSAARTALRQAMDEDQHLFILFYRRDDAATQAMRQTLEQAIAVCTAQARMVALNVQDPAEKEWVDLWKLSRSPMPLTIVLAPNRAVTGGFPLKITADQIDQAIVSRATAACLLAGQTQKLVLLCVHTENDLQIPAGVQQFQQDADYGPATEVVSIRADDPAEAQFLKTLKLSPKDSTLTALIAPPGSLLASYPETVTKDQLISTLKAARNSCCPGGKCGPGGCCPGGKCGPGGRSAQGTSKSRK